jgi:hypothetical protein
MPTPSYPAPKDHEDWPEPVVNAYYAALGKFLQSYGDAESGFLFLIDRYAGGLLADDVNIHTPPSEFWARTRVQMDVVRALVGSQRSAEMADTLKMLLRVAKRPQSEQDLAKEALDHLGHIRVIRDRIVHTGALPFYDAGWFFRTGNKHEVRERHKAKDYVFRIEDLEDMTADLSAIRLRLATVTLYENPHFHEFASTHGAFEPWRYKPIQAVSPDRTETRIQKAGYPRPRSPFETAFSIATSYPVTDGGPLAYAGQPRPTKGG